MSPFPLQANRICVDSRGMDILRNMAIGVDAYQRVQQGHAGGKKRDLSRDAGDASDLQGAGAASPDAFRELLEQQLETRLERAGAAISGKASKV